MKNKLFIFGCYSTALEIKEVAENNYEYEVFLVEKFESKERGIINEDDLSKFFDESSSFIFGFTDYNLRKKIETKISCFNLKRANIFSQRAYISKSVKVGKGIYIAPNSSISHDVEIKDDVIINYNAVIGHNSYIGENVIINPSAVIGGNAIVEDNCIIGAHSFIKQGVKIGKNVKIDALTNVFHDIEPNKLCTSRTIKIYNNLKY